MKKILLAFLFFGFALQSQSQKLAPVKWAYQAVKTGDKKYNIIITANVDAPWHIYSQFVKMFLLNPTRVVHCKFQLHMVKAGILQMKRHWLV